MSIIPVICHYYLKNNYERNKDLYYTKSDNDYEEKVKFESESTNDTTISIHDLYKAFSPDEVTK